MKINANIPALQASRHINKTNDKIQSALQKLSSGYKINNVSDDPTGTAVSSKIKAQLYGLKIASKNALDGVSLVQTAEGAISEINEMLKRMRELAVQAANDTNAPDDRLKIQSEIDELMDAVDQMADVTEFNEMKLLNGRLSNLTTITDSTGVKSYDLSIEHMSPKFPVGEYELDISGNFSTASLTATFSQSGTRLTLNTDTIEIGAGASDDEVKTLISELAERYNCVPNFTSWPDFSLESKEAGSDVRLELSGTAITSTTTIVAAGADATVTLTRAAGGFTQSAVAKIEGNRIIVTEVGGEQIQIDITTKSATGKYKIEIEDKGQLKLQTGANEDQRVALMLPGVSTFSLGLRKQSFANSSEEDNTVSLVNTKNLHGAEAAIDTIDKASSKLSELRSNLGAYQVRLERTVTSLDINSVNTEAALSRIQDTDMALEMSTYTLNNVILQSAISMLSQANERPQQLLQLLR